MKKFLLTLVLMVGIVLGLFAQNLTYQAVIRDNNQQLVVNTAVKATVTITFTSGDPYQAEFNGSTNLHGLLSIEFGDGSLVGRDWTDAIIVVKVVNSATPSIVYVNDEPRPVSAVPYALSVNGVAIQQYLTEHKYVTEMQVGNQIHDSISNVVGKAHTHDNKALLDTYTQTEANLAEAVSKKHSHDNMTVLNATTAPYTDADSTKLDGIEAGAEVNVQSDWKQTDGSKDDYIKNKPSITDTVNNILSTGGYVTADALDSRHYLTSDSTVITTMQGNITANATNITSLQGNLSAAISKEKTDSTTLAGRIDALENASMDCNDVKNCIKDTLGAYSTTDVLNGLLQQLEARLTGKIDSLAHVVDSLAKLVPGGDTTAFTCGTSKVKDVDNNEYPTVQIGKQCWMAQNLRTKIGGDGDKGYPTGASNDTVTYGRLYTWSAMMKGAPSTNYPGGTTDADTIVHGICPEGWHVPSDAEWDTLTYCVYYSTNPNYKCSGCSSESWTQNNTPCIAKALASKTGWNDSEESTCAVGNNQSSNNATGFNAVPAGVSSGGDFGNYANFWSATVNIVGYAWYRSLNSDASTVRRANNGNKGVGFSVRCLRDAGTGGGDTPDTPGGGETAIVDTVFCYPNLGANTPDTNTVTRGQNFDISTVSFTHPVETNNWEIASWNTKADGSGTRYERDATITNIEGNLTLYAQWRTFCTVASVNSNSEIGTTNRIDTLKDGDNNKYAVVQIGNQCWMAQNLRTNVGGGVYPKYPSGHTKVGKMVDDSLLYGRLYTWNVVTKGASTNYTAGGTNDTIVHGICPAGWHVPSDAEWDTLTTYVKSKPEYQCNSTADNIAKALASTTGWNNNETACNVGNAQEGNNATGFSAVPAGYCFSGYFDDFGDDAYFWSATQGVGNFAWYRGLSSHDSSGYSNLDDKGNGFSVRCLRD